MLRRGAIEKLGLCGKMHWKRGRRRQKKMFVESLNSWATHNNSINFIKLSDDREI